MKIKGIKGPKERKKLEKLIASAENQ